jgi:hypothetical protein
MTAMACPPAAAISRAVSSTPAATVGAGDPRAFRSEREAVARPIPDPAP